MQHEMVKVGLRHQFLTKEMEVIIQRSYDNHQNHDRDQGLNGSPEGAEDTIDQTLSMEETFNDSRH